MCHGQLKGVGELQDIIKHRKQPIYTPLELFRLPSGFALLSKREHCDGGNTLCVRRQGHHTAELNVQ